MRKWEVPVVQYSDAILILKRIAREAVLAEKSGQTEGQLRRTEEVQLAQAVGRVAAEDYWSRENIPVFANSSMDGFAVISKQTQSASVENPISLSVVGT